ncbi:MAG: serpin family protein [Phycisphaerae bacterium]|nr:serpin family protein [Phycisphaerae bacterium]
MRWSRIAVAVVAAMACGVGGGAMAEDKDSPAEKSDGINIRMDGEMAGYVRGMNAFGLKMYGQLAGAEGNVFFSPLSLHTALSMASVGARGETHAEMAKILGLPTRERGPAEEVVAHVYHEFFATRLNTDAVSGGAKELSVANGLWVGQRKQLVERYAEVMKQHFQSESSTLDFSKSEAAAKEINGWVAKKTKDRIQDIVRADMFTDNTVLVLANAVYFKSDWADKFTTDWTKDGDFRLGGDKTVKVKMMFQEGRFDYAETDDAQVLSMPYKGRKFSMVFVLPKKADGLAELEKSLSADQLEAWTKFTPSEVWVTLPRFKVTREFDAIKPLQALGMKQAFVAGKDGADFSGMVADERVWIRVVAHKAFVDVNEVGTEAAAATVEAMDSASDDEEEPKKFKADHPFLFMIRHNQTGAILFLGRLADPTKE